MLVRLSIKFKERGKGRFRNKYECTYDVDKEYVWIIIVGHNLTK